jgi:hypothetical protein
MLFCIWLVPCQYVSSTNPLRLSAILYIDIFTKDTIGQFGEVSLKFVYKIILEKIENQSV